MTALTWNQSGTRLFETGVDRGVLYPGTDPGVSWNGLTTVTESPSGAEASAQYADNKKYANIVSPEQFGGTIEAFTSPAEFAQCDGTASSSPGVSFGQQSRKSFSLAYRTRIGNDLEGSDAGYKIHIVYNALAAPSERAYGTTNDSPEALSLSWEFTSTPVPIGLGFKPASTITIDSTKIDADILNIIEEVLYGSNTDAPTLMSPAEIIALFADAREMFYNETTGYYDLVSGGFSDLLVGPTAGEFIISSETRLVATSIPGFYTLGTEVVVPDPPTYLIEDSSDSGTYLGNALVADSNDIGTFTLSGSTVTPDPNDVGTYLIGA